MARRTRRRRGTWMPILGTRYQNEAALNTSTPLRLNGVVPIDNSIQPTITDNTLIVIPVVPDFTQLPSGNTGDSINEFANLRDLTSGQDWVCERIVGKIHVSLDPTPDNGVANKTWPYALLKAGFFVARADSDDEATTTLLDDEVDPLGIDNSMDPWMWQRSWLLANPGFTAAVIADVPGSNARYGSVMDGPHIDIPVKRRIQRESRLWFAMSSQGFGPATALDPNSPNTPTWSGLLDVRVFGHLASARHSGSF